MHKATPWVAIAAPSVPAHSLQTTHEGNLREKGLEPLRQKAPDPKSGVSAVPPLSQSECDAHSSETAAFRQGLTIFRP